MCGVTVHIQASGSRLFSTSALTEELCINDQRASEVTKQSCSLVVHEENTETVDEETPVNDQNAPPHSRSLSGQIPLPLDLDPKGPFVVCVRVNLLLLPTDSVHVRIPLRAPADMNFLRLGRRGGGGLAVFLLEAKSVHLVS